MTAASQMKQGDVLVVGGGPAGSAAAIVLAASGLRVTLVSPMRAVPAARLHWISRGGRERLGRLGCGRQVREGTGFLGSWGEPGAGDLLEGHAAGQGFVVDREALVPALLARARAAGAELLQASLTQVRWRDDGWRTEAARPDGRALVLQSRFIVDASGAAAAVGSALGLRRLGEDGLVGWCWPLRQPASDGSGLMTLIESAPHGWWQSVDLGPRREVTLFSDGDLQAEQSSAWHSVLALAADAPATVQRLLDCSAPDALYAYPAGSSRLQQAGGAGWVALGDAAATLDPLGGGSLDFALACAERLPGVVQAALAGDAAATGRFDEFVQTALQAHASDRQWRYDAETRWPLAPFWARRRQWAADASASAQAIDAPILMAQ